MDSTQLVSAVMPRVWRLSQAPGRFSQLWPSQQTPSGEARPSIPLVNDYPYADRYAVNRTLPQSGRPRAEVLAEMREMATEEDAFWETGKVSGTMYCGDHEHYDFF